MPSKPKALPSKIKLGPMTIKVLLVDRKEIQGNRGQSDLLKNEIYIDKGQSSDQRKLTLVHELLHFMMDSSGAHEIIKNHRDVFSTDEGIVRSLDTITLSLIKDNPKLMEYLSGKD